MPELTTQEKLQIQIRVQHVEIKQLTLECHEKAIEIERLRGECDSHLNEIERLELELSRSPHRKDVDEARAAARGMLAALKAIKADFPDMPIWPDNYDMSWLEEK